MADEEKPTSLRCIIAGYCHLKKRKTSSAIRDAPEINQANSSTET
jgi:hypothetical protein